MNQFIAFAAGGLTALAASAAIATPSYEVSELQSPKQAEQPFGEAISEGGTVAANLRPGLHRLRALKCVTTTRCHKLPSLAGASPHDDYAKDINDAGVAVGYSRLDRVERAVVFSDGVATSLGTYNDDPRLKSWAQGINNSGVVVGFGATDRKDSSAEAAFVWRAGQTSWVPSPFGNSARFYRINDAGLAVGYAVVTPGGYAHAITYDTASGAMRDMGTVKGESSFGYAINSVGDIAGISTTFAHETWPEIAMRTNGGVMQSLGMLPGHYKSAAYGINDMGETVGTSIDYQFGSHAFLHDGRRMHELTDLLTEADRAKYTVLSCSDINNAGDITCYALRRTSTDTKGVGVVLKRKPG